MAKLRLTGMAMVCCVFFAAGVQAAEIKSADSKGYVSGFGPENTLDNDLMTRWSAQGDGKWIRFELSKVQEIEAVGIAWLHGRGRRSRFDIEVSLDGESWQEVFSGQSKKKRTWLEVYNIESVKGKFVRIVGHGNDHNNWNSILEVRIDKADALQKLPKPITKLHDPDLSKVGDDVFRRDEILTAMRQANRYTRMHPYKENDPNWIRATYYTGVMGLHRATDNPRYLQQAMKWAKKHKWQEGTRDTPVNKLTIGQTYLELYFIKNDPAMIGPIREYADQLISRPALIEKRWDYCDTLYVGPTTLAMLGKATGEDKYYEYMNKAFWDTHKRLFDMEDHLFYRDAGYIGKRTKNGKKIFWSRGNGWVMGGIVRILQYLPEDNSYYSRYEELLKEMAAALVEVQGEDGLWRANLGDAKQYPIAESSGSAFFCYALARGINEGILDKEKYLPVVMKAWKGLVAAVHDDGKLGWVQPVGAAPAATSPKMPHEYAVGLFLLAGEEMLELRPAIEQHFKSQPSQKKDHRIVTPEVMAVKVADNVLQRFESPPAFNWGEGVLLAGMMDAYELTGNKQYLAFVRDWADHWLQEDFEKVLAGGKTMAGYCGQWGPGYPLLQLYEATHDKRYLEMANKILDFMMNEAERTADGALCHFKGGKYLFVDTLWMCVPVFTHAARIEHKPRYQHEAVKQLMLHAEHVRDPETELYVHFYNATDDATTKEFWARGNGWVAMSFVEALRNESPKSKSHTKLKEMLGPYLKAIAKYQDEETGLWRTVMNGEDTYLETSASAMFLYAMVEADRLGLVNDLDKQVMRRAWRGLCSQVDDSGKVIGVSGGTGPSDFEYYATRPKGTYTWGTGAYLMAACAYAKTSK